MASVKTMRKGGPFYLCYKIPTGKLDKKGEPLFERVQKPSGLYDKSKALMLALSYQEIADAVAVKHFTESMAHDFLKQVALVANVSVAQTKTLEGHLTNWLESRKLTAAEKTYENYRSVIDSFNAHAAKKNVRSLAGVTGELVREYRDWQIKCGKSAATINKALSILGQAFEPAVVSRVFATNPARGLRIKGRMARPQTRRAFSIDEFSQLVAAVHPSNKSKRGYTMHPDWQTFLLILGYTGGRQQEVAKLKWENVDLKEGRVELTRSKTGDTHTVPLHPALRGHLVDLEKRTKAKSGPLMPYISEQTGRTLSKHFREFVLPRIGIRQPYRKRLDPAPATDGSPDEEEVKFVGRRIAECSLHSLRHSLSTWLHALGVQELTRMNLSGHANVETSRVYTHEDHIQMATAMGRVPNIFTLGAKNEPVEPTARRKGRSKPKHRRIR
jgi:integrase